MSNQPEVDMKQTTYSISDKLKGKKTTLNFITELKGTDVNISYFQENGFSAPILVKDKTGLGMRVPSQNFTVSDIKRCIGSKRVVDVTDSEKHVHTDMSMKEWVRYYENTDHRVSTFSVTNLEFTSTRLETYVEQPEVVRQIDWVYQAWPWYLRELHHEELLTKPRYPKVQRYCVMTVAGCYSDFHIDMGGSSIWYHVFHGRKTLWLIPPSPENFELFKQWCSSGKRNFLGDTIKSCQRVTLETGWTLFIPSGWIHGIYSNEDSLSFCGNFLHSFSIPVQLSVHKLESQEENKVASRYPYFNELHWYLLDRYVGCLTNVSRRLKSDEEIGLEKEEEERAAPDKLASSNEDTDIEEADTISNGSTTQSLPRVDGVEENMDLNIIKKSDSDGSISKNNPSATELSSQSTTDSQPVASGSKTSPSNNSSNLIRPLSVKLENCMLSTEKEKSKGAHQEKNKTKGWTHLTPFELEGLKVLTEYLENLPPDQKCVPHDLTETDELIKDAKAMLANHAKDVQKLAITGEPVLSWPARKKMRAKLKSRHLVAASRAMKDSSIRRRRVRCKKCEPCTRSECGECPFCKDMKKFGGLGKMKQTCVSRQCMAPILPTAAVCVICSKSEVPSGIWEESVGGPSFDSGLPALMECGVCWKIQHPVCLRLKYPELSTEGIINEDLPNSWECPVCCDAGKHRQRKPRVVKGQAFTLKHKENGQSSDESDTLGDLDKIGGPAKKGAPTKRKQLLEKEIHKSRKNKLEADDVEKMKRMSNHGGMGDMGVNSNMLTTNATNASLSPATDESLSPNIKQDQEFDRVKNSLCIPTPFPPPVVKVSVPKYVIRPSPIPPPPKYVMQTDDSPHILGCDLWMRVFTFLPRSDLIICMRVCKTWDRWCGSHRLWTSIDLSRRKIRQPQLAGIARRQPKHLDLSWTNINYKQLDWLINRLPHMKRLNLAGNSWPAISCLCGYSCPLLNVLDLSWVCSINDACIHDLLSPPTERRPGMNTSSSRLSRCTELRLAGSDIGNSSLEMIVKHVTRLKVLDLSYCVNIEDDGLRILSNQDGPISQNLQELVLTGCNRLTPSSFPHLGLMPNLGRIHLQGCPLITESDCEGFMMKHNSCVVEFNEHFQTV